jgi:replicative DNA helicase Mcm
MRFEKYETLVEFIETYCQDEVARLCQEYPEDSQSFWVDWMELFRADADVANAFLRNPEEYEEHIVEALNGYDKGVEVTFNDIDVRVYNVQQSLLPSDIRSEHIGEYHAIRGVLGRVTESYEVPTEIGFECVRCGSITSVKQVGESKREPHECNGCERKGPFEESTKESTFADESKLLIETPPDEVGSIDGGTLQAFVRSDLIEHGGEFGLAEHVGEEVVVHGIVQREARSTQGKKSLIYDEYLEAKAVEFTGSDANVDIEAHKDRFNELANQEDAIDIFAASLAPELYATPEWEAALELGVAYLFGAPRIDIENGPTYRGDIHALLISDYGMGKSTFLNGVEAFSPKCMNRSAAGLSSDVGLTAAAVQDEFGDGGWVIKPGILVRGNGGHVILDEIDKGPEELSAMNDGLEGDQILSVNKGGKDMKLKSRVGLLAAGNPDGSRFDPHAPVAEEIGIDQSLLSRFDGIITMRDTPDEEIDANVAEHIGKGYKEASEAAQGDREEFETLSRAVAPEVGRAWVKYARENIHPSVPEYLLPELKEWYAEEARQLNDEMGDDSTATDPPVPVTARVVEDVLRFSAAFARCELSDSIKPRHAERAKTLAKTLIGQTFRDGVADATHGQASQKGKSTRIDNVLKNAEEMLTVEEIAERAGTEESWTENYVTNLVQSGDIQEPKVDGRFKWVGR